jgi:hypothetical protein
MVLDRFGLEKSPRNVKHLSVGRTPDIYQAQK